MSNHLEASDSRGRRQNERCRRRCEGGDSVHFRGISSMSSSSSVMRSWCFVPIVVVSMTCALLSFSVQMAEARYPERKPKNRQNIFNDIFYDVYQFFSIQIVLDMSSSS